MDHQIQRELKMKIKIQIKKNRNQLLRRRKMNRLALTLIQAVLVLSYSVPSLALA